jgi:hypothetical protein
VVHALNVYGNPRPRQPRREIVVSDAPGVWPTTRCP